MIVFPFRTTNIHPEALKCGDSKAAFQENERELVKLLTTSRKPHWHCMTIQYDLSMIPVNYMESTIVIIDGNKMSKIRSLSNSILIVNMNLKKYINIGHNSDTYEIHPCGNSVLIVFTYRSPYLGKIVSSMLLHNFVDSTDTASFNADYKYIERDFNGKVLEFDIIAKVRLPHRVPLRMQLQHDYLLLSEYIYIIKAKSLDEICNYIAKCISKFTYIQLTDDLMLDFNIVDINGDVVSYSDTMDTADVKYRAHLKLFRERSEMCVTKNLYSDKLPSLNEYVYMYGGGNLYKNSDNGIVRLYLCKTIARDYKKQIATIYNVVYYYIDV